MKDVADIARIAAKNLIKPTKRLPSGSLFSTFSLPCARGGGPSNDGGGVVTVKHILAYNIILCYNITIQNLHPLNKSECAYHRGIFVSECSKAAGNTLCINEDF